MRPDDRSDDGEMERDADAMRRANRAAAGQLDERPDPRVRARVLAAAARGAGSRPQPVPASGVVVPSGRSNARRWSWSAAALLMVSIGAGLVAMRALREDPDRIVSVASNTTPAPPVERAPAPAEHRELARAEVETGSDHAVSKPAFPRPQQPPAKPLSQRPSMPRDVARDTERPMADATRDANEAAPIEARRKADESALAAAATSIAPDAAPALPPAPAPSAAPSLGRAALVPSMRLRSTRAVEPPTPEAWVERIVKLRGDGHDDEADRELDALRVRYPGFIVPPTALRSAGTR